MTRPPVRLGTVVMCHPSRLAGAERVAAECAPLPARIVKDPEPGGFPSPLRTAKAAWAAVAPGATHHLVVQDDAHLAPGFAGHVTALLERHPDRAVSLSVLWVSPYNSYRVRQAAVGGYASVRLAPWEWVPSLALALPADTARELAAYLAEFPDDTRDDDEHIAVFCAERGIPVVAPVPHLLDHGVGPSVAGNDHHGIRLAVACAAGPVATAHWDGPELTDPARHGGLGYAVELVASRCHVRIRRSGEQEAAEQPFTWPWRPWSALLGVAHETIAAAARAAGPAPRALPAETAGEVWAAGYLLGALTPDGGDERAEHRRVREDARAAALRSWITAGLRPGDLAALGEEGCAAAAEWAARAVAAGRAAREARPAGEETAAYGAGAPVPYEEGPAAREDTAAADGAAPVPYEGTPAAYESGPVAPARTDPAADPPQHPAVARMARREARLLLAPAPEELPGVRLGVVPCPDHPGADPALPTRDLPVRWLGEHLSEVAGDSTLVVHACERLEPRPLAGLAALLDGGWKGTVETRAATVARLRAAGLRGEALTAAVDDAERRFAAGDGAVVTLPAACRPAGGTPRRLWPHDDPELSAADGAYARLRLQYVRETRL
ncbi:hypothetical protein [Streptomyces sp. CMB-StM0423]|uniref:hypothetical protein n=1 Tax=Streptomyces sp. CMB-StM0423 TaxID=2059884 RepID=UPI000C709FF3|nr:hypothetical protein [Streptomyces sp. CMB-StM0423]AUH39368.1 hypothetical protein CXR04_03055 [Streptomyces sp. CMB-StM0423]